VQRPIPVHLKRLYRVQLVLPRAVVDAEPPILPVVRIRCTLSCVLQRRDGQLDLVRCSGLRLKRMVELQSRSDHGGLERRPRWRSTRRAREPIGGFVVPEAHLADFRSQSLIWIRPSGNDSYTQLLEHVGEDW
jgi:hypothetical protein